MPTLYDNFERVRQYIDQHQADVDLSSYVSKDELSAQSYATASDLNAYLPLEGGTISGRLVSDYYTNTNASGGIDSYSSVLTGGDNRNSVTMFATRRLCGDTSYAAAFFTNSDGRSKFTHKTKTSEYSIAGADDAFMCFNAYGFKIAYSGEQGVGATTEYEILHEGNIGNLGYVTQADLSANSYLTQHQDISGKADKSELNSYLSITNFTKPAGVDVLRLLGSGFEINSSGYIYPTWFSYTNLVNGGNYNWIGSGTLKNYVNGRLAEIEASYVTSSDLPVIDENIIPKENATYTLGDADHIYSASYTKSTYFTNNTKIVGSASDITFYTGGLSRIKINNNILRPDRTGVDLGTSSNKWAAAYISNLYADTIHNFIWTGTSAEYAALDNYTSYQIYLIQEA